AFPLIKRTQKSVVFRLNDALRIQAVGDDICQSALANPNGAFYCDIPGRFKKISHESPKADWRQHIAQPNEWQLQNQITPVERSGHLKIGSAGHRKIGLDPLEISRFPHWHRAASIKWSSYSFAVIGFPLPLCGTGIKKKLLQPEAFDQHPLQARLIDQIKGK